MRLYFLRYLLLLRHHYQKVGFSRHEYKRLLLTLQIIIFVSVSVTAFLITDLLLGSYYLAVAEFALLVAMIVATWVFTKGYFTVAKTIILVSIGLNIAYTSSFYGPYAGNQILWLPAFCTIWLFYSNKDYRYSIPVTLFFLLLIVWLEYTGYEYFKFLYQGKPPAIYSNYLLCFVTGLLAVSYFLNYLFDANKQSELKLKKLNTRLKMQNTELSKTNAELDSFVYKASHDLRAPLTSVLGLASLMQTEQSLEKAKEYAVLQEKSVKKLDTYITDILNISRNSRLEIEATEIHLMSLIEDTFLQLSYLDPGGCINKNITINQSSKFYTDYRRLAVIVNNLLANALRYCDPTKAEMYINVNIHINAKKAEIEVEDNGVGIEPMYIDKVFQMFYKANAKSVGSGLGLYIAKETVNKLMGEIYIRSEWGKHTTVTVNIPNMFSA